MFITIVLWVCIWVCGWMLLYRYITQWEKINKNKSNDTSEEKSYIFYEDEWDIRKIKWNTLYYEWKEIELDKRGSVKVEDDKVYQYDRYIWLDKNKSVDEYRIDWTSVFLRCLHMEWEISPDEHDYFTNREKKKNFITIDDGHVIEDAAKDYWEYKYSESNYYKPADIKKMWQESVKWLLNSTDWHEVTTDFFLYIFILYNWLSREEFLRYVTSTYETLKKADLEYTKLYNDFDKLPCYDFTEKRHKLYTKAGKLSKDKKKTDEFNKRYDEIISKIDWKYFYLGEIIDKHSSQMQVLKNMIKIAKES